MAHAARRALLGRGARTLLRSAAGPTAAWEAPAAAAAPGGLQLEAGGEALLGPRRQRRLDHHRQGRTSSTASEGGNPRLERTQGGTPAQPLSWHSVSVEQVRTHRQAAMSGSCGGLVTSQEGQDAASRQQQLFLARLHAHITAGAADGRVGTSVVENMQRPATTVVHEHIPWHPTASSGIPASSMATHRLIQARQRSALEHLRAFKAAEAAAAAVDMSADGRRPAWPVVSHGYMGSGDLRCSKSTQQQHGPSAALATGCDLRHEVLLERTQLSSHSGPWMPLQVAEGSHCRTPSLDSTTSGSMQDMALAGGPLRHSSPTVPLKGSSGSHLRSGSLDSATGPRRGACSRPSLLKGALKDGRGSPRYAASPNKSVSFCRTVVVVEYDNEVPTLWPSTSN